MLELLQRWAKLQSKVCRAMPSGTEFWCGNTLVCTQALGDAQRGAILMAVEAAVLQDCFGWKGGTNHESGCWAMVDPGGLDGSFVSVDGATLAEALLLAWVTYLEGVR